MHKLMNANKLNPCKLQSVAVIYSLVDGSFSNDPQRGLTIHATSGEPSIAFSLFCKRSHRIRFHFFFSLPDMGIISFLGFAREKKKKKEMFISWGKSQGNSMFIMSRGCNAEAAPGPRA